MASMHQTKREAAGAMIGLKRNTVKVVDYNPD